MLNLNLREVERRAFHSALRSSHTRTTKVEITDLHGNTISNVSDRLLDGQVTVDSAAEVTRVLSLTMLDPAHSFSFDSNSPDDGALFADRMLRVSFSYRVPSLDDRVEVPLFIGPVTKLDRSDDTVEIEAQGKESLALNAMWKPLTLKKGMRKTTAIRLLLRWRAGESYFAVPDFKVALPKTLSLDRYAATWTHAQSIAKGMDKQLFYTADGYAKLRALPETVLWTFSTGDGGDVVGDPQVNYSMEDVKNVIVVLGATPAGKPRVRGVAVADYEHPLSPWSLGRTVQGERVPRYIVETIEDDTIRTNAAALAKAERILNNRLQSTVEVTFDALPIPHLEPGDYVALKTDAFTVKFRLKQFTIPLAVSGSPTMSVGYLRKTATKKKRIRR